MPLKIVRYCRVESSRSSCFLCVLFFSFLIFAVGPFFPYLILLPTLKGLRVFLAPESKGQDIKSRSLGKEHNAQTTGAMGVLRASFQC